MLRNRVGTFLAFALVMAGLSMAGCAHSPVYLDEPTPAGITPPPEPTVSEATPQAQPYRPASVQTETGSSAGSSGAGREDMSIASLQKAYRSAGSPKLVVYVNRNLSAQIKDSPQTPRVTTRYAETSTKTSGQTTEKTTKAGMQYTTIETPVQEPVSETWEASLEDAITTTLLDAGCKVIDRRLLMRKQAATVTVAEYELQSVKQVEMLALEAGGQILCEIEAAQRTARNGKAIFSIHLSDIRSGEVMVVRKASAYVGGKWVATDAGYERPSEVAPGTLGSHLGVEVLRSLNEAMD